MIGQIKAKVMASEPTRRGGSFKTIFLEAGTKQLVTVYAPGQVANGEPVLEDRTYQIVNLRGFAGGLGADDIVLVTDGAVAPKGKA